MREMKKPDNAALRAEYVSRINRVIDYIEGHLAEELRLDTLARVARFSPYHFHRIFRAMVGETLNQFIQRRRVEKAALVLRANPKLSISEVALDYGFSGSAAFARVFKESFGVSASQWRQGGGSDQSKNCKTISKQGQALHKIRKDVNSLSFYINPRNGNPCWRLIMKDKRQIQVEVKDMPELCVAYVRHIGPYKGNSELFAGLFGKLCAWAGPRGLMRPGETQALSVYYDNPEITDEAKLRLDVCITVPEDTQVEGEIGKMTLSGGKFAVARFELLPHEYEDVWNAVIGGWLPESGYQMADRPCYEIYRNDPKEHPEGRCIVDICLPVKPL